MTPNGIINKTEKQTTSVLTSKNLVDFFFFFHKMSLDNLKKFRKNKLNII